MKLFFLHKVVRLGCVLLFSLVLASICHASENSTQSIDADVQHIKKTVIELNRDLFILEEAILYPANTRINVFVSMDVGYLFQLDGVKLTIDDKQVASELYTEKQVDALSRGAIQRLYVGNLKKGSHNLVAVFTGRGPKGRDYRRAVDLQFDKDTDPTNIRINISDSTELHQPVFSATEF